MDVMDQESSESYLQLKRRFSDFINEHQPGDGTKYIEKLESLLGEEHPPGKNLRLLIDVHDLRQFDDKIHSAILKEPCDSLRPCVDAARDAARGLGDGKLAEKHAAEIDVRFAFPACSI
jgi:hypothetical protein